LYLCVFQSKNLNLEDIYQQESIHFHTVFELKLNEDIGSVLRPTSAELATSTLAQIARYVAATNQVIET